MIGLPSFLFYAFPFILTFFFCLEIFGMYVVYGVVLCYFVAYVVSNVQCYGCRRGFCKEKGRETRAVTRDVGEPPPLLPCRDELG